MHVRESIRIEVPVADVYRFWRRLENLPKFMTHLQRVTEASDGKSDSVAPGPAGLAVEWDAEFINEVEIKVPVTTEGRLEEAPAMCRTFRDKHEECTKVFMKPGIAMPNPDHWTGGDIDHG